MDLEKLATLREEIGVDKERDIPVHPLLRALPLVHKLKGTDGRSIRSVLNDGLTSAELRGDWERPQRSAFGTHGDVFFAVGGLSYEPRGDGVVVVLSLRPSALGSARGTPWDSGAPWKRYADDRKRAVEVFNSADLPHSLNLQWASVVAECCWDDASRYLVDPPARTDPPEVLGFNSTPPSWIPEVRLPRSVPVAGNLLAVFSRPASVWADPDARALLAGEAERCDADWRDLAVGVDPFTAVDEWTREWLEDHGV